MHGVLSVAASSLLTLMGPMGGRLGPAQPGPKQDAPKPAPAPAKPDAPDDAGKPTKPSSTASTPTKAKRPKPQPPAAKPARKAVPKREAAPADRSTDALPPAPLETDEVADATVPGSDMPSLQPGTLELEYAAQGPALVRPPGFDPVSRGSTEDAAAAPASPEPVATEPETTSAAQADDGQTAASETESEGAAKTETETQETKWYDAVSLGALADAYASVNATSSRPFGVPNDFRAFDTTNGFALHWAGIDASYDGETFGGTVGLRFGPSGPAYNGADADVGLGFVKQAYATYKPRFADGALSFDLGKFDTLYGGEVADSQNNFNYTRGLLNWLGQPFFHTGLRVGYTHNSVSLTGIVVNGWNNSVDNNRGKTFGAQVGWTPGDRFSMYLGYLTGPENDRLASIECDADTEADLGTGTCVDAPGAEAASVEVTQRRADRRFRHFADLIVAVSAAKRLDVLFNADVGYDEIISNPVTGAFDRALWYGASLAGRVRITDVFATSLRGEAYHDTTGFTAPATWMGSGTLTLEAAPHKNLVLKFDSRYDGAVDPVFTGPDGLTRGQLTFTLGAVVATQ